MSDYTYIFDFDYTLFKTYEEIKVWSPRGDRNCKQGAYFPLLPNEYQSFKLAEDEYLNKESFSEFLKVDWGRASPIQPVLEIFNLVKSIVGAGVLSLPAGTYMFDVSVIYGVLFCLDIVLGV